MTYRMAGGCGWPLMLAAVAMATAVAAAPAQAQTQPAVQAMSPVEQLLARDACADMVMAYGHALDTTDVDAMVPLFTADGSWAADGKPPVVGTAALRALWADAFGKTRPTVGRHVVSNVRTAVLDADHATGTAFVTMFRFDPVHLDANVSLAPLLLVALDLQYRRVGGRWLFARVSLRSVSASGYRHGKS